MMSGGGESTAVDSNVAEATPSGKPRKQSKRHVDFVPRDSSPTRPSSSTAQLSATTPTRSSHNLSRSPTKRVFLLSPHQANPKADYAPLSPSHRRERISARRRSVTPIFPYEPPPERFTPPREVLCSPPQESPTRSRGNRRKSVQSAKGTRRLTLTIKKEPPVIDLSRPLPPPSPTDDPLLLSGPPRRRKSRACPSEARPVTPPHASVSHCFDDSLDADIRAVTYSLDGSSHSHSRDTPILASSPPARPQDDEDAPLPELLMAQSAQAALSHHGFTDDEEPQAGSDPIPIFSFNALDAASDDDWSDDPREEVAGVEVDGFEEGEYTGKFRMVAVPTKADPPSSCTRMRMDAWGRPKSPHPRLAVLREGSESPAENDEMGGAEDVPVDTELELAPAQAVEFEVEGESVPSTDHEEPDQADGEPSPAPDDAEGVSIFNPLDLAIDESSRTPSPPPNELATPLAEQDGADILMDDASDQDTLTEPEPDLTDDLITHLHSKGKEPAIVTSEFSLGSSSTAATEQPVEVEGFTEFLVPLRDDEDDWDAPSSEPPIQIHAESEGEENDEEDEEDCSDEAIVDRELSILPGDESEEEDEGAARVTEHASSGPFDLSKAESNYAPVKETQSAVDDDDDDLAGSSDEESEALDDGVIKITSDDPLAAARAAAILRLHDYDCVPRVLARKRRHSHLDVPSAMRDARRRSSTASGISKAAASTPKRRHTLGGMVGDKVIIPGSPALTIPELLKEAERSLQLEEESVSPHKLVSPRNAFVTPTKPAESFSWATSDFSASILSMGEGETAAGAWTRKDWKRLDSCLTDERLARGVGGGLADAESVDLEKVVDRFFAQLQRPSTALGHAALSR
ncbi:hypothetical protein DAEQUDRAFT_307471 [Daedalea quercina L-15889]|uniref:Uncharacterized protein n=1 Tax=Daedalea quercina L-15889 TaxID=1314783 RepID=A0A165Q318_9APHY|nr:hypothetical protein DAEQUDRAFT_307471 [Daedalea quercina L-15889]